MGYRRLKAVIGGYRGLQQVRKGLQGDTRGYRGYKGLKGIQGVTRG